MMSVMKTKVSVVKELRRNETHQKFFDQTAGAQNLNAPCKN